MPFGASTSGQPKAGGHWAPPMAGRPHSGLLFSGTLGPGGVWGRKPGLPCPRLRVLFHSPSSAWVGGRAKGTRRAQKPPPVTRSQAAPPTQHRTPRLPHPTKGTPGLLCVGVTRDLSCSQSLGWPLGLSAWWHEGRHPCPGAQPPTPLLCALPPPPPGLPRGPGGEACKARAGGCPGPNPLPHSLLRR